MTQRTASTRLDLPQPFGPTTPVSPGSISKVGRFDEGFEADQAQPRELHSLGMFHAPMPRRRRESLSAHAESRYKGLLGAGDVPHRRGQ